MKLYKGTASTIAFVAAFVFCANTVYAATFNDVAAGHWAYPAINSISDKHLMVGDTSGNFRPNDYINKFDTARVFARAAGYNYSDPSAEDRAFIDAAYDKNKNLLSSFARSFNKWDSGADREVAFLIEKGIILPDDLNQFIIRDSTGNQLLRALSREEAAVFLTRLMGQSETAIAGSYNYNFSDDSKISLTCKPYVYFLKEKGVVSGEAGGGYNPKGAVTRAAFAVLLDKTLALESQTQQSTGSSGDVPVSKVETVSGKIEKLYPSLNAVQILTTEGNSKIYKMNATADVTIDNYMKKYADLTEGMVLIAVIVDGNIADIKAQSPMSSAGQSQSPPAVPVEPVVPAQSQTTAVPVLPQDTTAPIVPPADYQPVELILEGIVTKVSEASGARKLDIEVRILSPRGEVISTAYSFIAAENCVVTRGENTVEFDNLLVGDIAKLKILDGRITSIDLEQKDITINGGVLLSKKFDEQAKIAILSVQSPGGRIYDFRTTDTTHLSRNGSGNVSWNYLRVGDKVELVAEYDKLLRLFATGEYSYVNGIITEVNISKTGSYLVVSDDQGKTSKYGFISSVIDFNSLKIGNRVWLRLDSLEIESFSVIESGAAAAEIGYVAAIRSNTIVITDSMSGSNSRTKEVVFDGETVFTDGRTGARVTVAEVHQGMKVNITLANANSNLAKALMILE